ncbi:hypothetical protein [Acinetobacter shaoyimingii]|uniref:Uncharacterized protein n=1 Tax=Acinetobacter shaoyimingii TaxID=2715164 RepID=A0A6G8RXJ4_9GAMM|nr:hypothetical protein [Acinetobacter shaoyimingii]QIO06570.1 hypothetical protein G8E00_11725 [Acinetobacter shaoyimingii]
MNKIITLLSIGFLATLSFNSHGLSIKLNPDQTDSNRIPEPHNIATESSVPLQDTNEYDGGDLYPGTIHFKNNRYILSRCTSGGDDYVLEFIHHNDQKTIDQLINTKAKFWINLFGVYSSIEDEHHLKVKDASDIHIGQSCHLKDALEILSNEED